MAKQNDLNKPSAQHTFQLNAYDPIDDMMRVKSNQKKWKTDFYGTSLNPNQWETVQTGAGQTVTVSGGTLTMAMGTTANAETILMSKETFTIPVKVSIGMQLSQKIINNEVYMELVSVDPKTGVIDTTTPNLAQWRIAGNDSLTNTVAQYFVQAMGIAAVGSGNQTTVAHTGAWALYEIEPFTDECWFHARVMDSTNGRSFSGVRHQNIPNPNSTYKIRLRIKNGATAPASNTNAIFQFVNANDYAELTAEITAGRGNVSAGQAIAAQVVNAPNITTVTTAYQSPKSARQTITTSPITTATPFQQAAVDCGSTQLYDTYRMRFRFDQPMKVEVQHGTSSTNTSNAVQNTYYIAANTPTIIDEKIFAQYISVKITNLGTATTTINEAFGTQLCIGNINNANPAATGAVAVTLSDTAYIGQTKGIYVGVSGDVVVTMANGSDATFTGLAAGVIHPISAIRIKATGTTAQNVLAVY